MKNRNSSKVFKIPPPPQWQVRNQAIDNLKNTPKHNFKWIKVMIAQHWTTRIPYSCPPRWPNIAQWSAQGSTTPGIDGIPSRVFPCWMMNGSFFSPSCSTTSLTAKIVIQKSGILLSFLQFLKGIPTHVNNYCGISLLVVASKIYNMLWTTG